jgi:GTP-binding protein
MKPVIALVGRPNVGKSTLFNRLTRSRDAIVADFAGLTRDRHYGRPHLGQREYIVIDTGGFEPRAESGIYKEMAKQTRQAVAEADVVVFVVDARAGLSAQDHDIADYLRRLGKPCLLVANKAEGMREGAQLSEFYELGLGEVIPVSAAHGQGVRSLVEGALDALNLPEPEEAPKTPTTAPSLAVAGRPNVGKSTLINTWLGEERLVAFDLPGTTRDAISVPFERNGQKFELIDTAGLRRKGKVFEAIEKFSVVKTLQAIESANVVLLLLDATQGVTDQDAHIAGFILESRARRGAGGQQVGCGGRLPARTGAALDRDAAGVPEVRRAALHLGRKRQGLGPAVGLDRQGAPGGHAQDADAAAHPRCCWRRCSSRRPSAPACSGPSCVTPTRAA